MRLKRELACCVFLCWVCLVAKKGRTLYLSHCAASFFCSVVMCSCVCVRSDEKDANGGVVAYLFICFIVAFLLSVNHCGLGLFYSSLRTHA